MKKKTVTINLFWALCVLAIIATVAWNIKWLNDSKEVGKVANHYIKMTETVDLDNYLSAIEQISNYPGEEKPSYDRTLESYKEKIEYLKGLENAKSETLMTETLALRDAMKEDITDRDIYNAWEVTYWEDPLWIDGLILIVLVCLIGYEIENGFGWYCNIPVTRKIKEEKSVDC